ncbi:CHAP domain-containing protein [Moraxella sp. VT-16-12]|uniref:CHAP domain-containing protein n=1 Tax=Moraxella sp. VT-16-12 TaxID=2014877 RepID=UPI000B7D5B7C|nr:CHAP domain-containing protein [Moraxella sp. VT-16-12]TWV81290.1 CHAP domain-containing protein [Moraxella sp. VT-16-12]
MKKIFWLASAIGLTVGSANAQSGTISISSEDGRKVFIVSKSKPEAKTMSDAELDQAIDGLVASSQSRPLTGITSGDNSYLEMSSNNGYDEAYRDTQLAFNQFNKNTTSLTATLNSDAPRIAARAATRAAHGKSLGRCALYVRKALQSAGYKFTPQPSAYMYASKGILAGAGFTKLSNHNYTPQVGDVAVFNRSGKHPHGHIQIYDGNQWVSDFRQNKFSPYSQHNGYTVWRDTRYIDASNTTNTHLAFNE